MRGNPCLIEADFINWLCDDCSFVCLSENVACVRVGKSEDHFIFFLVIHQKWLMKSFFGKNGRILGNFSKGA